MISKNAVGLILLFLSMIGVEVNEANIIEVVSAIGTIVSFILLLWNQVFREDVENFLFKKENKVE